MSVLAWVPTVFGWSAFTTAVAAGRRLSLDAAFAWALSRL
jgi:hypothetical protein